MSPAGRPALRLATPAATPDRRSDLVRLCAGEPVALAKVDLIAFVNSAYAGLDPDVHPDNYALAELALERFHSHVGTSRRTKGERATDIVSQLARYIIPFAVELAASRPQGRRGREAMCNTQLGSCAARPGNCRARRAIHLSSSPAGVCHRARELADRVVVLCIAPDSSYYQLHDVRD